MNIIINTPNPSGAYQSPESRNVESVPDGYIEITCDTSEFYNGFIIPIIENNVVTSYVCNTEAWSAWKAEEAAKIPVTPEPTIEERTTALEATQSDVIDILASALGVTI